MIRFISFLLGKEYEPCKGCSILKQQLALVNEEKKELTSTLIAIIKPAPPVIEQINQPVQVTTANTFSRRRAALEERDRLASKTVRESTNLGKPDNATTRDIDKLENDLGIVAGTIEGSDA